MAILKRALALFLSASFLSPQVSGQQETCISVQRKRCTRSLPQVIMEIKSLSDVSKAEDLKDFLDKGHDFLDNCQFCLFDYQIGQICDALDEVVDTASKKFQVNIEFNEEVCKSGEIAEAAMEMETLEDIFPDFPFSEDQIVESMLEAFPERDVQEVEITTRAYIETARNSKERFLPSDQRRRDSLYSTINTNFNLLGTGHSGSATFSVSLYNFVPKVTMNGHFSIFGNRFGSYSETLDLSKEIILPGFNAVAIKVNPTVQLTLNSNRADLKFCIRISNLTLNWWSGFSWNHNKLCTEFGTSGIDFGVELTNVCPWTNGVGAVCTRTKLCQCRNGYQCVDSVELNPLFPKLLKDAVAQGSNFDWSPLKLTPGLCLPKFPLNLNNPSVKSAIDIMKNNEDDLNRIAQKVMTFIDLRNPARGFKSVSNDDIAVLYNQSSSVFQEIKPYMVKMKADASRVLGLDRTRAFGDPLTFYIGGQAEAGSGYKFAGQVGVYFDGEGVGLFGCVSKGGGFSYTASAEVFAGFQFTSPNNIAGQGVSFDFDLGFGLDVGVSIGKTWEDFASILDFKNQNYNIEISAGNGIGFNAALNFGTCFATDPLIDNRDYSVQYPH